MKFRLRAPGTYGGQGPHASAVVNVRGVESRRNAVLGRRVEISDDMMAFIALEADAPVGAPTRPMPGSTTAHRDQPDAEPADCTSIAGSRATSRPPGRLLQGPKD
jgi:hypothetical protein